MIDSLVFYDKIKLTLKYHSGKCGIICMSQSVLPIDGDNCRISTNIL